MIFIEIFTPVDEKASNPYLLNVYKAIDQAIEAGLLDGLSGCTIVDNETEFSAWVLDQGSQTKADGNRAIRDDVMNTYWDQVNRSWLQLATLTVTGTWWMIWRQKVGDKG